MSNALPSADLQRLIESLQAITGDQIAFVSGESSAADLEHSWDVISASGERHGVLRVRTAEDALDTEQHRLYTSLSQIIADNIEMNSRHTDLLARFEVAGQQNEELTRSNARLRESAFEDTVTGLYRRSYLQEQLRLEISRAQRYERPFAIILADIDHFKAINDSWGHAAGDTALRHLSRLMKQSSRTSDIVSRLGGDEFCLLLTDTDEPGSVEVAQRILDRCMTSPVRWGEVSFNISISIGLGSFEHDGITEKLDPEDLLNHVDQALYRSKNEGRGRLTTAPRMTFAEAL